MPGPHPNQAGIGAELGTIPLRSRCERAAAAGEREQTPRPAPCAASTCLQPGFERPHPRVPGHSQLDFDCLRSTGLFVAAGGPGFGACSAGEPNTARGAKRRAFVVVCVLGCVLWVAKGQPSFGHK